MVRSSASLGKSVPWENGAAPDPFGPVLDQPTSLDVVDILFSQCPAIICRLDQASRGELNVPSLARGRFRADERDGTRSAVKITAALKVGSCP